MFPVYVNKRELLCFDTCIDRLVWTLHPTNRDRSLEFLSPEEYKYALWAASQEE